MPSTVAHLEAPLAAGEQLQDLGAAPLDLAGGLDLHLDALAHAHEVRAVGQRPGLPRRGDRVDAPLERGEVVVPLAGLPRGLRRDELGALPRDLPRVHPLVDVAVVVEHLLAEGEGLGLGLGVWVRLRG